MCPYTYPSYSSLFSVLLVGMNHWHLTRMAYPTYGRISHFMARNPTHNHDPNLIIGRFGGPGFQRTVNSQATHFEYTGYDHPLFQISVKLHEADTPDNRYYRKQHNMRRRMESQSLLRYTSMWCGLLDDDDIIDCVVGTSGGQVWSGNLAWPPNDKSCKRSWDRLPSWKQSSFDALPECGLSGRTVNTVSGGIKFFKGKFCRIALLRAMSSMASTMRASA